MMRTKIAFAAAAVGVVALAGCGTSAGTQPTHSPAATPTTSSAAPVALTCGDIRAVLATALHDLKKSNRHLQEAWVSGGYRGALKNLINDTLQAANGSQTPVTQDASTFNADASNYLSANSPYLAPGWESGYQTVNTDIDHLAIDCNVH